MFSDEEEMDPNVLPFNKVNFASVKGESLLQGKLSLCSPYRDGVAKIQIKDEEENELSILFRGEWAEEAIKNFASLGRKVCIKGKYGVVEAMKKKSGGPQLDGNGNQMYCVAFPKGVKGWWGWNKGGKKFNFRDNNGSAPSTQQSSVNSTQQRYIVESTNPHSRPSSRPSSKSTSKDLRAIARLTNRTGNATLDEEILAVPEPNPENPYKGQAAPRRVDESDSELSDDSAEEKSEEEDEQPMKKKQKRVRREDRREWGLKSEKTKLQYTQLSTFSGGAGNQGKMNVIAIAILKREIFKTKNDPSTEIWLYDPTQVKTPIRLNFFGPEDKLPVFENGDVLIIQELNWQKKNNWLVAFGGLSKGRFLVIPDEKARSYQPGSDLVKTLPQCAQRLAKFSEDELIYARDLALWSKRYDVVGNHVDPGIGLDKAPVDAKQVSKQLSKGGGNGRKQVTISQLEPTVFADVQGEIVKFYNPHSTSSISSMDAVQLYITDYTRNEQMICYEDISQVRLPGQYTLQISVYGHQAKPLVEFSRNPEEDLKGRFVNCRNVRPKLTDENVLLEATMFIDAGRPNKTDVMILPTDRVQSSLWYKDFNARRKRYCGSSLDDKVNNPHLTMNTQEIIEETTYDDPFASPFNTVNLDRPSPLSSLVKTTAGFTGTSLTTARVIDYKPDKIEDFVVAYCPSCEEPLSKGLTKCVEHDQVAYMFQFALLLSDDSLPPAHPSSSRLLLEFTGRHADAFFPGLPPSSSLFGPSASPSALASFRRRLEPLLGNLPTLKRDLERNGKLGEPVKEEDLGELREWVVESWEDETQNGRVRWRCDERRTLFYDPEEQ